MRCLWDKVSLDILLMEGDHGGPLSSSSAGQFLHASTL